MKSREEKRRRRKAFKIEKKAIRNILNDWDPISGSPWNEYECLVHWILSLLHRGGTKIEISSLIKDKLEHHFGLNGDKDQIEIVSGKIWSYWSGREI